MGPEGEAGLGCHQPTHVYALCAGPHCIGPHHDRSGGTPHPHPATARTRLLPGGHLPSHPHTKYQVAEHVKARFCNEEWMAAQLDKTVNEIVVVYVDTKEVHNSRPSPDHEYAPIPSHRA